MCIRTSIYNVLYIIVYIYQIMTLLALSTSLEAVTALNETDIALYMA